MATDTPLLVASLGNHRLDLVSVQPPTNSTEAIPLVCSDRVGPAAGTPGSVLRDDDRVEDMLEALGLMGLAGRDRYAEGQAPPVRDEVELSSITAT